MCNIRTTLRRAVVLPFTAAFVWCLLQAVQAATPQQTGVGILEDLESDVADDTVTLQINFSVPIRYVRHFPAESGDVLQISVRPVTLSASEDDESRFRETLEWTPNAQLPLLDVTYEGETPTTGLVTVRFREAVQYTVDQTSDSRSLLVVLSGRPAAAPVPIKIMPATPPEPTRAPVPESMLDTLMASGKQALTAGDNTAAIRVFTRLLEYPAHKHSAEARELLGLARERNNQLAHAKAEYEMYLALYPQGEGADRVRQRLSSLLSARKEEQPEPLRAAKRKTGGETQIWGGLSQYYRRDESTTDDIGDQVNNSSLTTLFDVTARNRSDSFDQRAQFTASYVNDFLADSGGNELRVSSLYYDAEYRPRELSARLGRQSRSTGGVLGRFDGALLGWQFVPKWKLNGVVGSPVELSSMNGIDTDKLLYGLSVDGGPFAEHWETTLYTIQQDVNGIIDRQAVGGELRYTTPGRSHFALLDYDTSYSVLNTFLLLSNWTLESGMTFNMVLDYRQTPTMTTSNALIGQTVDNMKELRDLYSDSEIRRLAEDRTAISKTVTVGMTVPVNGKFQFGADVTGTSLSATPASGGVDATEATGNEILYNLQLIGSNLIKEGDVSILGLSFFDGNTSDRTSLTLNSRYPFNDAWRANPRLRIDYQSGATSDLLTIKPSLRVDYRFRKDLSFELEGGLEWADDRSAAAQDTQGYYVSLGYRWSF